MYYVCEKGYSNRKKSCLNKKSTCGALEHEFSYWGKKNPSLNLRCE